MGQKIMITVGRAISPYEKEMVGNIGAQIESAHAPDEDKLIEVCRDADACLTYLEPFHPAILKFLQWKAKAKVGKREDAERARQEFVEYTLWMKKEIGGMKYTAIRFEPRK